jgi:hypothetical protein
MVQYNKWSRDKMLLKLTLDFKTKTVTPPPPPPPPSPPPVLPPTVYVVQNVQGSALSSLAVELRWTDTNEHEDGYYVERAEQGQNFTRIATLPANSEFYVDTSVQKDKIYFYRIQAFIGGNRGPYSQMVMVSTASPPVPPAAPQPPTGLTVTNTRATQNVLTWKRPTSGGAVDLFVIERKQGAGSYAEIATVSGRTVSYIDNDVIANTQFTYRVKSRNTTADSAYSSEATVTTAAAPVSAPTSVQNASATALDSSSIELLWSSPNSGNEKTILIRRSDGGGAYREVAALPAQSTSYLDRGLKPNLRYRYEIIAENEAGSSSAVGVAATTKPRDVTEEALLKPLEMPEKPRVLYAEIACKRDMTFKTTYPKSWQAILESEKNSLVFGVFREVLGPSSPPIVDALGREHFLEWELLQINAFSPSLLSLINTEEVRVYDEQALLARLAQIEGRI